MKVDEIRIDRKFEKRLPEPTAGEFEALCESIETNGIMVPLAVTEDGLLLDGHRRLKAAKKLSIANVPTKTLKVGGARTWGKAFAIALNLHRRQLDPVPMISLGSSLKRIETTEAKKRHSEAVTKPRNKLLTKESSLDKNANTANARLGKKLGVSRKAVDDWHQLKDNDPKLHAEVEKGEKKLNVAVKELRQKKIKAEAKKEAKKLAASPTKVETLQEMAGKCRTVYADPPWSYNDEGCQGSAAPNYPTMTDSELAKLPVGELAHKDGCLYWIWTTWPMIRQGTPHELIETWGLRWVGELVWVKPGLGVGRWLRPATEILILAVKGKPTLLENTGLRALLEAPKGKHSQKPVEAYEFIERISPETRLELFQRGSPRKGWFRWGLEA